MTTEKPPLLSEVSRNPAVVVKEFVLGWRVDIMGSR